MALLSRGQIQPSTWTLRKSGIKDHCFSLGRTQRLKQKTQDFSNLVFLPKMVEKKPELRSFLTLKVRTSALKDSTRKKLEVKGKYLVKGKSWHMGLMCPPYPWPPSPDTGWSQLEVNQPWSRTQSERKDSYNILHIMKLDIGIDTVEPCILEQIDHIWGLAVAKLMI